MRLRLAFAIVLLSCACGELLGGSSRDDPPAPLPPDAGEIVADAGPPQCDLDAPFADVRPLVEINTSANEHGAHLTADELTMFFARNQQLFRSTRASRKDVFAPPERLVFDADDGGVLLAGDFDPVLEPDGVTLYFSSTRAGYVDSDIWRARANEGTFGGLEPVPGLATRSEESHPYPTRTGMWLAVRAEGARKIWYAPRTTDGFRPPAPVQELSDLAEASPVLTPDELRIYFGRIRELGEVRIFTARRTNVAVPFETPVPVTELDGPGVRSPSWVSPDGCRLYFQRSFVEGGTDLDVFVAEKPRRP